MKRGVLATAVIFLLLTLATFVNGQVNPFAAKIKTASSVGFMPQNAKMISGLDTTASRHINGYKFTPASHPLPHISANKSSFGEKYYNEKGQLIFFTGTVPGGTKLNLKATGLPEASCFEYLDVIKKDLKIEDAASEFKMVRQHADDLGYVHARMQQVYKGIPVYGREIYLHSNGEQIASFNGNTIATCDLTDLTPDVDASQAKTMSLSDVSARTIFREMNEHQKKLLNYSEPESELVIYPLNNLPDQQFLAWHITVRPNFAERWEYFIDAETGAILHFYNNTHFDGDVTATGPDLNGVNRTVHCYLQGGSYLMVDVSRPMYNPQNQEGTVQVYDANYTSPSVQGFNPSISTSSNNTWSAKVISSQYNASVTYEYFRTAHNKNSWNNQGGSVLSVINATEDNGSGMDNAYWNGVCVVYGNGADQFKPLQGAMDVVAHEFGHAYDEGSANLEYQNQSGALNEAYADIAAAVVERQNWKIGEDIVKPGIFPGGCLRDMSNPHNGGSSINDPGYQPAHVSEMYLGTQDNGGVHINSGVVNFAFYKFATATGMDKGEKVFFRALFNYLTRSAQFIDCRLAVVQSAKDLYGDGSAEVNAAKSAFDAVGITDGSGGNYQNTLPVNPGQDYVLSYDMADSDPATLYVSSTTGTDYVDISQTSLLNKPSVVDNGSVAVFIGADKKMHSITLTGTPTEEIIQQEAIWSNVAISKDGKKLAAVTEFQDSAIYIYSYQKQEWVKAHLYNPTTQVGVITNNVLYADALEWDYSGEFILYDAYNQMNSSTSGQNIDYWDISFMRVWDNGTNNWGDGTIFKMVSGIPEGISIGNPSLSKNSPKICAFDYLDGNTNTVTVLASNLETGDFIEVYNNGTTLSYPNYSKLDDKIIFSAQTDLLEPVVASIAMSPDKIHPATAQAYVLIPDAKWGVWFSQGNRALDVPVISNQQEIKVFPNPARDEIYVEMQHKTTSPVKIELYDALGKCVYSTRHWVCNDFRIDLTRHAAGLYMLNITCGGFSGCTKVIVNR